MCMVFASGKGGKKNGTKTKVNNFFVMRYLKVSFTHSIPYDVRFMNFIGFFATTKGT